MRSFLVLMAMLLAVVFAKAETYVVCVGIASYASPDVPNLRKTEKDAKSVAEFYKKGTDKVITITGKYATKSMILRGLRSQFDRAETGDKIIFYFSGHGYPGGFCPYDMMKIEDGVTYAEVIEIMKKSKATDKFIFADACNSGAIRQGGSGARPEPGNIMLFLSSRGNEYSIENAMMSNGIFTGNLLRGLGGAADYDRNRKITASEIFKYVSKGVRTQTRERQHPVMWGNFASDTVLVEYKMK